MKSFITIGVLCCCIALSRSAPFAVETSSEFDPSIVEGDIKLPHGAKSVALSSGKLWLNKVVPYTIESVYSDADLKTIRDAMDLIETKTGVCIKFKIKTNEAHYIAIKNLGDGACYSYIGNVSLGGQPLSLGKGCVKLGTVVHELCHALGFYHEQNRPDRDSYVKISFENVKAGMEDNFNKYEAGNTLTTAYDYKSIMHYSELAFSKNEQQTITPLQEGIDLIPSYDKTYAQILTDSDVKAIRLRYQCNGPIAVYTNPITTTTESAKTKFCRNYSAYCNNYDAIVNGGIPFPVFCASVCNARRTKDILVPLPKASRIALIY